MRCRRCTRTSTLALASKSDCRDDGIVKGSDRRKILFKCGEREDAHKETASGVNATVVNGRAIFEAASDFESYSFLGAANGGGASDVDFRPMQIFAKHFRVCVDVVLKRETGSERLFHNANGGGESVLDDLLNANA